MGIDIEDIAEKSFAHVHSVEKRLLGRPVRGSVGKRIDAELARRGIRPGIALAAAGLSVEASPESRVA